MKAAVNYIWITGYPQSAAGLWEVSAAFVGFLSLNVYMQMREAELLSPGSERCRRIRGQSSVHEEPLCGGGSRLT